MTSVMPMNATAEKWRDAHVTALVSAAHFTSHYFILLLPPLFLFIRDEYQVSFTEIGFALLCFNLTSMVFQTPAGYLVDRTSASMVLIGGLLLGAASIAVAGLAPSFWMLVAAFGIAGIANAAYHPADYALLSQHISPARIGQAFSVHTFAGLLGAAVAPPVLLTLQITVGWRGALICSALLGIAVAALLLSRRQMLDGQAPATAAAPPVAPAAPATPPKRLLMTEPIIRNLIFFVLLAIAHAGMQNYSVVALGALHGMSPTSANAGLAGFLLFSSIGVLIGGALASRTERHEMVAAIGLAVTAAAAIAIAAIDLGTAVVIAMMVCAGLFFGATMPSRDMIVRSATPPGGFGKVFGFVMTGFNIGGIVSPVIFGYFMDTGRAALVFVSVAVTSLVAIALARKSGGATGKAGG